MSKLAEEILKVSRSWKPDGVNFPLTDEEKLALIDEKLSGVSEILREIGDEYNEKYTYGSVRSSKLFQAKQLSDSLKVEDD